MKSILRFGIMWWYWLSWCFSDATPPDLRCPASVTRTLGNINDDLTENFNSVNFPPVRNVDIGIPTNSAPTLSYSILSKTFSAVDVNASPLTVQVTSVDLAGNTARCTFTVSIIRKWILQSCGSFHGILYETLHLVIALFYKTSNILNNVRTVK